MDKSTNDYKGLPKEHNHFLPTPTPLKKQEQHGNKTLIFRQDTVRFLSFNKNFLFLVS